MKTMPIVLFSIIALFGSTAALVAEEETSCVFCDEQVIEKQKVWETKKFYILADYAPITHGHLLVVPKGMAIHVLTDLPDKDFIEFGKITKKIQKVFTKMLNTDQYIVLQKNGKYAGQTVNHLHFHFIPVQTNTNRMLGQFRVIFKTFFWTTPLSDEALHDLVEQYRVAFSDL